MNDEVMVWVHGDCLSPTNPALQAHPQRPAVYVWDEQLIAEWRISLKRILFMYECLLALDVEIVKGDPAEALPLYADRHQCQRIVTVESVSPHFEQICQRLGAAGYTIEILPMPVFVALDNSQLKLKSFSSYWRKAQQAAFG